MLLLLAQASNQLSETQMWALISLGAAGIVYVTVIRPMMRRKADPLERPPAFGSLAQQRSVERQMQNLLVEFSEMARQISAQLDTRAAKLDALIKEADGRIAALKSTSNAPASTAPPPSQPIHQPDPRHADIYALADQGRDAHQIADELNRPCGEIELILALRSKG